MPFDVFVRDWWVKNPSWPDGREPGPGEKTYIKRNVRTEQRAREICKKYNDTHDRGPLDTMAEYERSIKKSPTT